MYLENNVHSEGAGTVTELAEICTATSAMLNVHTTQVFFLNYILSLFRKLKTELVGNILIHTHNLTQLIRFATSIMLLASVDWTC